MERSRVKRISVRSYTGYRRLKTRIKERSYRKNPKISDTRKFAVITLKVEQDGVSLE